MIRFRGRVWVLLVSVGLLAPTRAANPRVTLRLESVTCEEAALALSRAAGCPVEVVPWPRTDIPGSEEPPLADLNKPARFVWNNVPLAQAMRELGTRYSLRAFTRLGGGYRLTQQPLTAPEAQYGPLARTEVRGMQIQVRAVTVSGSYPGQPPGERLVLKLHGQALHGDASAVVSVEDLVARDDRGGVLVSEHSFPARLDYGFPDEWSTSFLQLTGLQPGAKRLELLEGVLIAAPILRTSHVEIPLPLPASGAQRRLGAKLLELNTLQLPAPLLFVHPSERQSAGPLLLARLTGEEPDNPGIFRQMGTIPLLVGASGKSYAPNSVNRQGRRADGIAVYDLTLRYPAVDEPLVRIQVDQEERQEQRALGTFRIRNIPLPAGNAARAGSLFYGGLQSAPLTSESLDYGRGGGILVSPVQVSGRPAPPGQLTLGLSAADGSTGTRWYDVEVGAQGSGVLADLRPGAYRVLRVYRALRPEGVVPTGWWKNDETVIRVEAGKEARLPPLQLIPGFLAPAALRLPALLEELKPSVDRVNLGYSRSLELLARPETRYDGTLTLDLSGQVGGVETSRLIGLGNVVARDDRGILLTQRYRARLQTSSAGEFQGLKWSQSVTLNPPHPEARSLAWIEGDLLAFGRAEKLETDVRLPIPAGGLKKAVGSLQLEVDSVDELQPEAPAGQPVPARQYRLRGRVLGPAGADLTEATGKRAQPQLIGRSGTGYSPVRTFDSVGPGRWEFRCRYEVSEPVDRFSFKVAARTDVQSVGSFRLLQVQLPEPRPIPPPKATLQAVRRRQRSVAGEARLAAFEQEGGADLLLPVRLADRRAAEGSLVIGMSAQTPRGWGPYRWVEVGIVDGEVLLRDVRPGTYRLIRSYRAAEPKDQPSGGRWSGAELQVTLVAGKTMTVPPLIGPRRP